MLTIVKLTVTRVYPEEIFRCFCRRLCVVVVSLLLYYWLARTVPTHPVRTHVDGEKATSSKQEHGEIATDRPNQAKSTTSTIKLFENETMATAPAGAATAVAAAARRLLLRPRLLSLSHTNNRSVSRGSGRTMTQYVIRRTEATQIHSTGQSRPGIRYQQDHQSISFFSPSISRYSSQQWLSTNFNRSATQSCSFSTGIDTSDPSTTTTTDTATDSRTQIRLSKLISHYASNMTLSRSQADKLIKDGQVTMYGQIVTTSWTLIDLEEILGVRGRQQDRSSTTANAAPVFKVKGKPIFFSDELFSLLGDDDVNDSSSNNKDRKSRRNIPHVWAVHKVEGEVVSERDPQGRQSLIDRLQSSGVGKIYSSSSKLKRNVHLKPIGRLDMMTEGLMLVTNSGEYAREMELPKSNVHRVYRARVHGQLTVQKLDQIRYGRVPILKNDSTSGYEDRDYHHPSPRNYGSGGSSSSGRGRSTYAPMKVVVEKMKGKRGTAFRTNTWLRITSTDGKNRQIRNVFASLGMTVTRLIRYVLAFLFFFEYRHISLLTMNYCIVCLVILVQTYPAILMYYPFCCF